MKKGNYIIFLFFVVSVLGCSSTSEFDKPFKNAITQISPEFSEERVKAVVIIPNTGCTGCITYAELFLRENYTNNSGVKFILTSVESKKMLKVKMGIELGHDNIIIDDENLFSTGVFNSIYPITLYFDEGGNVIDSKYTSLEEDGLVGLIMDHLDE